MKGIILNSGIGKRMGTLTEEKPKCLLEIVDGRTIIEMQIDSLIKNGIKNIIITTGYESSKLVSFLNTKYQGIEFEYVHNDKFNSTNNIYSLFLTKDLIDDDVLLMHGDLVFEDSLLQNLLRSEYKNNAIVNKSIPPPEKDFKGKISNGLVIEIGVGLSDDNCFFLAPLYTFSKGSFEIWINEMERQIEEGKTNIYAETALNHVLNEIELHPLFYEKEICLEIDEPEDLEDARRLFR